MASNTIYDFARDKFGKPIGDGVKTINENGEMTFSLKSGTKVVVKPSGNTIILPEGIEIYATTGDISLLITEWIMQNIAI